MKNPTKNPFQEAHDAAVACLQAVIDFDASAMHDAFRLRGKAPTSPAKPLIAGELSDARPGESPFDRFDRTGFFDDAPTRYAALAAAMKRHDAAWKLAHRDIKSAAALHRTNLVEVGEFSWQTAHECAWSLAERVYRTRESGDRPIAEFAEGLRAIIPTADIMTRLSAMVDQETSWAAEAGVPENRRRSKSAPVDIDIKVTGETVRINDEVVRFGGEQARTAFAKLCRNRGGEPIDIDKDIMGNIKKRLKTLGLCHVAEAIVNTYNMGYTLELP